MKKSHKRALIVAYYLSKFDTIAYQNLGYSAFSEAFDDTGRILNVNRNTVKNMRDEFDPLHDNNRVGWYQRDLRPSRKEIVEKFDHLEEVELRNIVEEILTDTDMSNNLIEQINANSSRDKKFQKEIDDKKIKFSPRKPTGNKAENLFLEEFKKENFPIKGKLNDTRAKGTGYDFSINKNNLTYFVEVKGLAGVAGTITFTSKEWDVAREKKDFYYLVVINNILTNDKISIHIICNPYSNLEANKNIYTSINVNWQINFDKEKINYNWPAP